ncbi:MULTISPECIES: helix-turn-helix domain-containing protein [unclassified Streptomyces]|uniref:helix-turn-helix domain-containing protein n=1 Tax=unclassified Streptomyces TaxID=2593676 RepID=UPI002259F90A|nr:MULTISPECIES: helix-turn-helix transcriptional regulator [unclassified Streptomyces]WSP56939.1 helix-turn-helix transcriptional regulator [Streptomyces sp. NBC_01241]WSU22344.1 helix-turn-helix transcriptional regulator [Streptomyces sp. NBC_01108]MCX4788724.1 helix-turn-helix transcriptional regulator [Streptomyces sp. NBC_01221]MCX4795528.1 helix-turn-helix transcriptional regulator [Streptomyces sp. NBC_01242]WSJ36817.1 helix-turn-helix transcriptional regulator [Streptomyces sp. NBC_013
MASEDNRGDGDNTADGPDWEFDVEDDSGAVIAAVGRQIRLWREAAGLRAKELGDAIGYGENQVYKVEAGKRIPKPEFLDKADQVLGAGGKLAAMKQDVAEARYPKKVRDLAKLERAAVELGAYGNHNVHGLLQTEEYARALYEMRRPSFGPDEIDRHVAGRMGRQEIFERRPLTTLTFVQEEVTIKRPLGGRMVARRQLEHLLDIGQLRNVEIQVMPTDREDHAGMGGQLQLLKFDDGTAVAHWEGQLTNRLISDPKQVRIIELRYGIIRAQALTPRESLAVIEKALGET